jgi:hypothetical protein
MTPARDPIDPKNLIREAYRIEGIGDAECRSTLVDWALSLTDTDPRVAIAALLDRHADAPAGHPMTAVLREGLAEAGAPRRRGGRAALVAD